MVILDPIKLARLTVTDSDFYFSVCFLACFGTGFHYVDQASLELEHLLQPPKCRALEPWLTDMLSSTSCVFNRTWLKVKREGKGGKDFKLHSY